MTNVAETASLIMAITMLTCQSRAFPKSGSAEGSRTRSEESCDRVEGRGEVTTDGGASCAKGPATTEEEGQNSLKEGWWKVAERRKETEAAWEKEQQ